MIALVVALLMLSSPAYADLVGAEVRGVNVAGVCGDGVLGLNETCDSGAKDTASCDSGNCTAQACGDQYLNDRESCPTGVCYTAGTDTYLTSECRSYGADCCNKAENCTGSSEACPADSKVANGGTCSPGCTAPSKCNGSGSCLDYNTVQCPTSGALAANDDDKQNLGTNTTQTSTCSMSGSQETASGSCVAVLNRAFGDTDCTFYAYATCCFDTTNCNAGSGGTVSGSSETTRSASCPSYPSATSMQCKITTNSPSNCEEPAKLDQLQGTVNYYD